MTYTYETIDGNTYQGGEDAWKMARGRGKKHNRRWTKADSLNKPSAGTHEPLWICPTEVAADPAKLLNLTFQASDAKKPLLSVRRVVEKGNRVHFGPTEADCFIVNPQSGKKMPLRFNGKGAWVMEVAMEGAKHWITVDSGAEESVCPKDWGASFPALAPPNGYVPFKTAQGHVMGHYGQRTVQVSPF